VAGLSQNGRLIGHYQIEEHLGSGGYVDVYRARDTVRKQIVALKLLTVDRLPGEQVILAFLRQAELASDLIHPHLAWVWEAGQADGCSYIAERFVDGLSLSRTVTDGGLLTWKQALQVIREIAQGLDFAHSRKWAHGNVSLHNILVSPTLGAVLTDFGLTRAIQATLSTDGVRPNIGSPRDTAPELWQGAAPGPASDQYALACVCAEILTGYSLFEAPTQPEIEGRHLAPVELPPLWPVGIPWQVNEVLEQALAKDSHQRYPSVGDFAKALEELAVSEVENPEEHARRVAQEKAWLDTKEQARQEAEEVLRLAALEQARREIDEQLQREAEERTLLAGAESAGSPVDSGDGPSTEPQPASQSIRRRSSRPPVWWQRWLAWVALGVVIILLAGFALDSRLGLLFPSPPTATQPPPSATMPPTVTATAMPSATASQTLAPTTTATASLTPSPSVTSTPTATPTITATFTRTPTSTAIPRGSGRESNARGP